MACVLVTPNSSINSLCAGDIIELPMDLEQSKLLDFREWLLVSYARNALVEIMATCHAFFPEGQL